MNKMGEEIPEYVLKYAVPRTYVSETEWKPLGRGAQTIKASVELELVRGAVETELVSAEAR